MHTGVVDVAAAARRGLRWLLRGRRVHGGQGCGCGGELMVEGWWCETSRGHFLRGCLKGCALQELSCGGAVLGRAPADRDWTVLFWVQASL